MKGKEKWLQNIFYNEYHIKLSDLDQCESL